MFSLGEANARVTRPGPLLAAALVLAQRHNHDLRERRPRFRVGITRSWPAIHPFDGCAATFLSLLPPIVPVPIEAARQRAGRRCCCGGTPNSAAEVTKAACGSWLRDGLRRERRRAVDRRGAAERRAQIYSEVGR